MGWTTNPTDWVRSACSRKGGTRSSRTGCSRGWSTDIGSVVDHSNRYVPRSPRSVRAGPRHLRNGAHDHRRPGIRRRGRDLRRDHPLDGASGRSQRICRVSDAPASSPPAAGIVPSVISVATPTMATVPMKNQSLMSACDPSMKPVASTAARPTNARLLGCRHGAAQIRPLSTAEVTHGMTSSSISARLVIASKPSTSFAFSVLGIRRCTSCSNGGSAT